MAEVAVSVAIVSILFLVMLPMFSRSTMQITGIQEGHEVNEIALKTLSILSRELRQANAVYAPEPIDQDAAPPFVYSEDAGAVCRLRFTQSVYRVVGKTMKTTEVPVELFLGEPKELGQDSEGRTVVVYGLFQTVDGQPKPSTGKALVHGIHELVFWRKSATAAPTGPGPTPPVQEPGVGSQHLYVKVRAARSRRIAGVLQPAYGVELETMIRVRGKKL